MLDPAVGDIAPLGVKDPDAALFFGIAEDAVQRRDVFCRGAVVIPDKGSPAVRVGSYYADGVDVLRI